MLVAPQWVLPILSALFGLSGVIVGAFLSSWLLSNRDRTQRKLNFIEKQLSEFYAPMVGLAAEV
jgi:hypothetical protein